MAQQEFLPVAGSLCVRHHTARSVQDRLAARGLTPREHLVDAGYVAAAHLVSSRTMHDCDLVGPTGPERSWQARADAGFATTDFVFAWEARRATRPQGRASVDWKDAAVADGHPIALIRFGLAACRSCPVQPQCVASGRERVLRIRRREEYEALQATRQRQRTPAFAAQYAARAGIEGTISQGVHRCGLRRARYIGLAKTQLQHLLTGTAMNFVRLSAWFAERPRAATRPSRLALLAA